MSGSIIDETALRKLSNLIGGDPADFDELLADYLEAAPDLARKIATAAEAADLEALRIAAHTLKSNARDFGALQLWRLCEDLERECRAGTIADARERAATITASEEAARQILSALRTTGLG